MSTTDVDRTLYEAPGVPAFIEPAGRPVPIKGLDYALHATGFVVKSADAPLPPSDLTPAVPYDPYNRLAEIKAGTPDPSAIATYFASLIPALPVVAKSYDVPALRRDLADAQAERDKASAEAERHRGARARVQGQIDSLAAEVERVRADRRAMDLSQVDRLREAALAGDGLALPVLEAEPMSEAERGIPVLQALVARLDGDAVDRERILDAAVAAVDRIISELMEAEAEALAEDLWEAKRRVAGLHARLDGFTRIAPPHMRGAPKPHTRIDVGGGQFLFEPDLSALTPARFLPSPAVSQALHRTPGLDVAGFPNGESNFLTEGNTWDLYAEALRTDARALLHPIPEGSRP